jgi:hypothetical protein
MTARHPAHGERPSDVKVRAILRFGIALAGLVVAALGLCAAVFFALAALLGRPPARFAGLEGLPPAAEPRLQANPPRDLRDYRRHEEALLSSAGWVNREAGIIRIPIERAMALVAERGLPHRKAEEKP